MITFEQIQEANKQIKTTDIKGKDYAEVNQRIKAFRMVFPDGFIKTDIINDLTEGVIVMKAKVGYYNEQYQEVVLGTGTAYEKENSTFINKTSYIENCETSAIGRALGMAGFGIDTAIASYEEVANAQSNQVEKIKQATWKRLNENYTKDEIELMKKELGITNAKEMSEEYAQKKLMEKVEEFNKENPPQQFYD